jgi:transketolase
MEGVSHEACSLAGTLGLGKLTVIYDDNGISIDGEIEGWFTDDTPARFAAYGWHVIPNVDGHSSEAVEQAIDAAIAETSRPTIICCKTTIGKGSPNKQGTESCHGAPLGEGEIGLTREALGWPYEPFVIPEDVYAHWDARDTGVRAEAAWTAVLEEYRGEHPELAGEFERRMKG